VKTDLQIFANHLQNVGIILKFVAQKGGLREVGPPPYYFYTGQGNYLEIVKTDLQMFANYLQNNGIILKPLASYRGGCVKLAPLVIFFLYRLGNLFANCENQFANICKLFAK